MRTQSRYHRFREKCELLNFERYCRMLNVDEQVIEAFYDSQADLCIIYAEPGAELDAIRTAAALSLTQYQVDGWVGHKSERAAQIFKAI